MQLSVSISIALRDDKYRADKVRTKHKFQGNMSDSLRRPLKAPKPYSDPSCCFMLPLKRVKHFHGTTLWRSFHTIKREIDAGMSGSRAQPTTPPGSTLQKTQTSEELRKKLQEKMYSKQKTGIPLEPHTLEQYSGGEAHLKNVWWGFLWALSKLWVFSNIFILAVMTTSLSDDANWESLPLSVIHVLISCTVKISFCSLYSLTTKQKPSHALLPITWFV